MNNNKIPMQHPTMLGNDGKPKIQLLNKRTVDSGKAAKMGYIPVQRPEAPPVPKFDIPEVQVSFSEQSTEINEEPKPKKAKITKAQPTKLKA